MASKVRDNQDVKPEKKLRAEERRFGPLLRLRSKPESSTRRRNERLLLPSR